ncbi:MAG: 16S rRNA (adenine(1518)-N(6)/adenine(1519)-N(6))-dimethyltransferase RsmA [Alphaproteobacteria bacterium]|nr:16S rRNA (adenine(1518)-N(6)/adenine(1519)-N(6))-dimethyltransferase RsmA [Alphaproteobacteria bacterium]
MADEPALPPLREVIARHGIAARKALGQNFLLDTNLLARIARACAVEGRAVVEIGAGPGGLTRALLAAGATRVVAVERDQRCVAALGELAAALPGRLEVVDADTTTIDAVGLVPAPATIVGNLPFNVATPLIVGWLGRPDSIASMTLMVQREVADRLTATPGAKDYGRLAVLAGWRWRVARLFDVAARAFVPPPKVTASVLRFEPMPQPVAEADARLLGRVAQAAFGQRRKMLRSSLRALSVPVEPLLAAAGIDPTRRAETLTTAEFCAIARALAAA